MRDSIQFFLLNLLIVSIECGGSLRDYIFIRNSSNILRESQYLIYNSNQNSILCQLETSINGFNSLTNLLLYPSNQRIAFILNSYSPLISSYGMNIYDIDSNKWIRGSIMKNRFDYTINYSNKSYLMINRFSPSIIEIYQENFLLSRFSLNSLSMLNGQQSEYNIKIYSDILPDPVHIFGLYIFDQFKSKQQRFPSYFPFG